jgi:hypothetical protein
VHAAGQVGSPTRQLLLYRFEPRADFGGRLLGALERMESGGALRVVDGIFVTSDAQTGQLVALAHGSGGAGSFVAPLLGFRLDASERARATERALGGESGETLRELGEALEPGAAVMALLVEHVWAGALADAVSWTGGTPLANEFVDAATLADLASDLLAAAEHRDAADGRQD